MLKNICCPANKVLFQSINQSRELSRQAVLDAYTGIGGFLLRFTVHFIQNTVLSTDTGNVAVSCIL